MPVIVKPIVILGKVRPVRFRTANENKSQILAKRWLQEAQHVIAPRKFDFMDVTRQHNV